MTHIINFLKGRILIHFSQNVKKAEVKIFDNKDESKLLLRQKFTNTDYINIPFNVIGKTCYVKMNVDGELINKTININ